MRHLLKLAIGFIIALIAKKLLHGGMMMIMSNQYIMLRFNNEIKNTLGKVKVTKRGKVWEGRIMAGDYLVSVKRRRFDNGFVWLNNSFYDAIENEDLQLELSK